MHLTWREKTDIEEKLYAGPKGRKLDKEIAHELVEFTLKYQGTAPAVSSLESTLGRSFNNPPYAFGYVTLSRIRDFLRSKIPPNEFDQTFPPSHPLNASKAEADGGRRSLPRDGWKQEAEEFARSYFVALGKAVKVRSSPMETGVERLLAQEKALFERSWSMLAQEARDFYAPYEIDSEGGKKKISSFEAYMNARLLDRSWNVHATYLMEKGSTEDEPIVMCAVENRSLQFLPNVSKSLSEVTVGQLTKGKSSLKAAIEQIKDFVKPFGPSAVRELQQMKFYYLFLPDGTLSVRFFCHVPFDNYSKVRNEKITNYEELSHHKLIRVVLIREKRKSTYKVKGLHWNTSCA